MLTWLIPEDYSENHFCAVCGGRQRWVNGAWVCRVLSDRLADILPDSVQTDFFDLVDGGADVSDDTPSIPL